MVLSYNTSRLEWFQVIFLNFEYRALDARGTAASYLYRNKLAMEEINLLLSIVLSLKWLFHG